MLAFDELSFWEKETFTSAIDYLIVGSGIVGLSAAIELRGRFPKSKIMVLERGYLPTGASTKNAGFSCFGSPSELLDDLCHIDRERVIQTIRLRWEGLKLLQARIPAEKLNFEACGSFDLFAAKDESAYQACVAALNDLNALIEEAIGLKDCFSIANSDQYSQFTGIIGALFNQYEGKINTGSTMAELLRQAHLNQIHVLNGMTVKRIISEPSHPAVETQYGVLSAKKIIVCTNGFSRDFFPDLALEPARAQVLVTAPLVHVNLPSTYHYDKGYYYFRTVGENRLLIGGARNADFDGERTTELACTSTILSKIQQLINEVIIPGEPIEIDYQWAGIMGVGKEKYPIIKEVKPGVIAGIRLGGMGVAMGSAVGKKISELC